MRLRCGVVGGDLRTRRQRCRATECLKRIRRSRRSPLTVSGRRDGACVGPDTPNCCWRRREGREWQAAVTDVVTCWALCTEVFDDDGATLFDEDDIDICGASVDGDAMQFDEDENIDVVGGFGSSGSVARTA